MLDSMASIVSASESSLADVTLAESLCATIAIELLQTFKKYYLSQSETDSSCITADASANLSIHIKLLYHACK